MKVKKLYLIKREVLASSMKTAISGRGRIYEITEASPQYQPEKPPIEKTGFKPKKK